MAKRGRKPTPNRLLKAVGSRHARPDGALSPDPKPPRMPSWLDAAAKTRWKALAPELSRLGVLTCLDGDALACYCQAWSEFEIATKLLRKEGRTVVMSKTGYVSAHPAIAMQRSAWSAVKSFAALLGLDPSSRQSLPERYPDGEVEAPPDHLRYFDGDAL